MQIDVIDLHFQGVPECVASFLVHAPQGPFLIECGPSTTRERLVDELGRRGIRPGDLRALLVTHIHLDHAGSAGFWAGHGVPVYVHHLGAEHLADPSKLVASATRIYGDRMETLWGEVAPVPSERIRPIHGDQVLEVAGLRVEAVETPGHARHHHAFALGGALFTGDVAAVSLPVGGSQAFVSIPAPPPEFDVDSWLASLDKLLARSNERLYLTHFGPVEDGQAHLRKVRDLVPQVAQFVGERRDWERDKLIQAYYDWHKAMGLGEGLFEAYEKANPLYMSVDGLLRYWKKRDKA